MAKQSPGADVAQRVGAAMLARYESRAEARPCTGRSPRRSAPRGIDPAIPALRAALGSDDRSLAYSAGWGLHWLEGTPPPSLPG